MSEMKDSHVGGPRTLDLTCGENRILVGLYVNALLSSSSIEKLLKIECSGEGESFCDALLGGVKPGGWLYSTAYPSEPLLVLCMLMSLEKYTGVGTR